jgi:deoxycytidine triphosphate deaminase
MVTSGGIQPPEQDKPGAGNHPEQRFVTLEISNTTPLPAKIYANEELCQILFFQRNEPCETSDADRKGKYQKQRGIVLPQVVMPRRDPS